VKARSWLLALCAASAAWPVHAQREPEWFDAFRDKAYLQGDSSWVAREASASPESPPLFRLRWLVVRYAGFTEKWREFWPYRNVVLVTMPAGTRYVVESSLGFVDENHLDEERPWQRVASERAAFEVWASGTAGDSAGEPGTSPCEGMRERVRAAGAGFVFFVDDLSSPTVRTTLREISEATFEEGERRDLAALLRISSESNPSLGTVTLSSLNVRNSLMTLSVAFRDQVVPRERRTVVLAPDPSPPSDLATWRALAHLPLELPPFPALPPEGLR